jgi:hypothetical protein
MKKSIPIIALVLFSSAVVAGVSSCNIDKCKLTVCKNEGSCSEGTCTCPTGFTGNRCQDTAKGTITYVNNSDDSYVIYLNRMLRQTLEGRKSATFNVVYGFYECEAVQYSGYSVWPEKFFYSGLVSDTSNLIVSFP